MADASKGLLVSRNLTIPSDELDWRFSSSGGPGGQHANTSNTKVMLSWSPRDSAVLTEAQRTRLVDRLGTVVRVVVDDERSQARNRDIALERLREKLSAALQVRKRRRPTAPTSGAVERRLEEKRRRSQLKTIRRVLPEQPG